MDHFFSLYYYYKKATNTVVMSLIGVKMTKLCLPRSEDMDKGCEGRVGVQKDHVNVGRTVASRMCLGEAVGT